MTPPCTSFYFIGSAVALSGISKFFYSAQHFPHKVIQKTSTMEMVLLFLLLFISPTIVTSKRPASKWEFSTEVNGTECLEGAFQISHTRIWTRCLDSSTWKNDKVYFLRLEDGKEEMNVDGQRQFFLTQNENPQRVICTGYKKGSDQYLEIKDLDFSLVEEFEVYCETVGPFVHQADQLLAVAYEDDKNHFFDIYQTEKQVFQFKEEKKKDTFVDNVRLIVNDKYLVRSKCYVDVVPRVHEFYTHYLDVRDWKKDTNVYHYQNDQACPSLEAFNGKFFGLAYFNSHDRWYQLMSFNEEKEEYELLYEYHWGDLQLMEVAVDKSGASYLIYLKEDWVGDPDYIAIEKVDINQNTTWSLNYGKIEQPHSSPGMVKLHQNLLGFVGDKGKHEYEATSVLRIIDTLDGSIVFEWDANNRYINGFDFIVDSNEDGERKISIAAFGKYGNSMSEDTLSFLTYFEI